MKLYYQDKILPALDPIAPYFVSMERRLEQHMNRLVLIVWLQLAAVTFGQNCSSECSVLCSDGMVICANVDGFPEFEESTKPSIERL